MKSLEEARKEKGISQKAVASNVGIARQTYSKYERHPELMSIEQAKSICSFIGCDIAQIFFAKNS